MKDFVKNAMVVIGCAVGFIGFFGGLICAASLWAAAILGVA